ncbi:hypothetical protein MTR_3g451380 [Medicago truncatula]|uniref:Uncharacterized protein n=1 Tax=Medicago truncatula TaxID=3880 RepID=A0A072UVS6_MEDTR|nr:hypothetical protein MTR_3g451380 [Medicago truncatula]
MDVCQGLNPSISLVFSGQTFFTSVTSAQAAQAQSELQKICRQKGSAPRFSPRGVAPGKRFAMSAFATASAPGFFPHKRPFCQGFCPFDRDFAPGKRLLASAVRIIKVIKYKILLGLCVSIDTPLYYTEVEKQGVSCLCWKKWYQSRPLLVRCGSGTNQAKAGGHVKPEADEGVEWYDSTRVGMNIGWIESWSKRKRIGADSV